jgi:anti-sigma factor ChrR (cupin superfamily)
MSERDPSVLLAALAGLVPDLSPGDESRVRMRAALLARLPTPTTHVLRHDEGEWQALLPGIRVKTLRKDLVAGTQTTLWRVDAGATIPPHPHRHEEECLILEGSIIKDEVEYLPGDFLLADAGELHSAFRSPRGALFLIRGELVPDPRLLARLDPGS